MTESRGDAPRGLFSAYPCETVLWMIEVPALMPRSRRRATIPRLHGDFPK